LRKAIALFEAFQEPIHIAVVGREGGRQAVLLELAGCTKHFSDLEIAEVLEIRSRDYRTL
jgi:hypothetical protein